MTRPRPQVGEVTGVEEADSQTHHRVLPLTHSESPLMRQRSAAIGNNRQNSAALATVATWSVSVITACLITGVQPMSAPLWRFHSTETSAMELLVSFLKTQRHFNRECESRLSTLVHNRGLHNPREVYLDNPLVRLTLVRRLVRGWSYLVALVKGNSGFLLQEPWMRQLQWPTEIQVEDAAFMLMRVQTTYGISTDLLSKGFIFGQYSTNVTADDCFSVAKSYMEYELYSESSDWLREALSKIDKGDVTVARRLVLQHMFFSLCATGDVELANYIYIELLKKHSWPILFPKNLARIQKFVVDQGCEQLAERIRNDIEKSRPDVEQHGRLCRGEGHTDNKLVCRYVHHNQPHLRLQPFKLEELQLDPPVIRFHDAITDMEAEALIKPVLNSMEVAKVNTPAGQVPSPLRSSEVAWVYPGTEEVHDVVTRRMSDMTGLNALAAEPNQMARYGLSGEYYTHHDYISSPVNHKDQRIATLMFYLSDVKRGGHTVFWSWNLSVAPVRNSAVFWFNQLRDGSVDPTSDHSGCPVLQGVKWVLNKWFHNGGNEFLTPCGRNVDDSFRGFFSK